MTAELDPALCAELRAALQDPFDLRRRAELNESLSTPVIASVAKQSSAAAPKAGLLRYARNDAVSFARRLSRVRATCAKGPRARVALRSTGQIPVVPRDLEREQHILELRAPADIVDDQRPSVLLPIGDEADFLQRIDQQVKIKTRTSPH